MMNGAMSNPNTMNDNEKVFVKQALNKLVSTGIISNEVGQGFSVVMGNINDNMAFTRHLRSTLGPSGTMPMVERIINDYCNAHINVLYTAGLNALQQQKMQYTQQYQQQPYGNYCVPQQQYGVPGLNTYGESNNSLLLSADHLPAQTSVTNQQPSSVQQVKVVSNDIPDAIDENVMEYTGTAAEIATRFINRVTSDDRTCTIRVRGVYDMAFSKTAILAAMSLEDPVRSAHEAIANVHASLVRTSPEHEPFIHNVTYTVCTDLGLSAEDVKTLRNAAIRAELYHIPSEQHARNISVHKENYVWMIRAWTDIINIFGILSSNRRRQFERNLFGLVARKNNYDVRSVSDVELTTFPTSLEDITKLLKSIDERNALLTSEKFAQVYLYNLLEILSAFFLEEGVESDKLVWMQGLKKEDAGDNKEDKSVVDSKENHYGPKLIDMHINVCNKEQLSHDGVYWVDKESFLITNLPSALRNKKCIRLQMPMDLSTIQKKIPQVLNGLAVWLNILCERHNIDITKDDYQRLVGIRKLVLCGTDLRDGYAVYDVCQSVFHADSKPIMFLDTSTS